MNPTVTIHHLLTITIMRGWLGEVEAVGGGDGWVGDDVMCDVKG